MIASTQTNHPLAAVSPAKSPASIDVACARLKSAGLRITQPRVAILEALLKRTAPASIEQIHNDLASTACDLVTVYRCLAAFQEVGLVRLCYFHNGTSLYQIALDGDAAPYHIVSKDSNDVTELDAESSAELRTVVKKIEETLKSRGYTDVSHLVEFFAQKPKNLTRDSGNVAATAIPAAVQQRSQSPVVKS
ncbi:Fur family transcriptional regulator [Nibricoccus aquaticus]|uniref:Fur family transcriptional regulator n=1 Tax=Nibricoccus aquaticus TaxID=2576891 RepID=A0A290QIQ0_9BACT|nr:transcriptional repressor [Nibricoccus aquaticus]ATC65208.1 Fur family transcriptional regulator [Nibricoccus aquaticus]